MASARSVLLVLCVFAALVEGLTWTKVNPNPTSAELQAIAVDQTGTYVVCGWQFAVNTTANIIVSEKNDLTKFESAVVSPGGDVTCNVVYDAKLGFLVIYEGTAADYATLIFHSVDGKTWTRSPQAFGMQALGAAGNGLFVFPEMWMAPPRPIQNFFVSTDGISWSKYSSPLSPYATQMLFAAGRFFAYSYYNNGTIYESIDGATWRLSCNLTAQGMGAFYSITSLTLTEPDSVNGVTLLLSGMTLNGGATVLKGAVFCSIGAICKWEWETSLALTDYQYPSVGCSTKGVCLTLAYGYGSTPETYSSRTTDGGRTWTTLSQPVGPVTSAGALVFNLGSSGLIQFSADGIAWSTYDEGVVGNLAPPLVYGGNQFVVAASPASAAGIGGLYSSKDGVNWNRQDTGPYAGVAVTPAGAVGSDATVIGATFTYGGTLNITVLDSTTLEPRYRFNGPPNCCGAEYHGAYLRDVLTYNNRVLLNVDFCSQWYGCFTGGTWSAALPSSGGTATWSPIVVADMPGSRLTIDVVYGNGLFLLGACNTSLPEVPGTGACAWYTSTDGVNFARQQSIGWYNCDIAFAGPADPTKTGGLFFTTCNGLAKAWMVSSDGRTWTNVTGLAGNTAIEAFSYLDTPIDDVRFVATSAGSFTAAAVFGSADGSTWRTLVARDLNQVGWVGTVAGTALAVSGVTDDFFVAAF